MRKNVISLFICLALIFALSLPVFAANQVMTIDIVAVINSDGSMNITQVWEGQFEEGTEVYIPMNAPDYLTISELTVKDQNGAYETLPEWDVDSSFEKKARKCGIHDTESGYEICFGISQYGQNCYTISYKLDNVVGGYTDRDGVNFRFVNNKMNTTPTDVTVQILLADGTSITDEIADIWGFGFMGRVEFYEGSIVAFTETPLDSQSHVTILFSLEKGVLSPSRQESGTFEEVRQRAFEGSDYDEPSEDASALEVIIALVLMLGTTIGVVVLVKTVKRKKTERQHKKLFEKFGYFRDIPNEGNLSASYVLGKQFELCKEDSVLATGILRLIELGCLCPVETQDVGIMGKTKEAVNLRLMGSQHSKMNEYDEYLYTVLEGAAGPDGILQANELEQFASQNDRLLRAYIDKHNNAGRLYLNQKRCFKQWNTPSRFDDLTPAGEKELGELIGLMQYLKDFSLIAERGVKEMPIWRELLTYAMLFGIADQVAAQMRELYPQISAEITYFDEYMYTAYSYQYLLYHNMIRAEQARMQEERSDGSGGFTSFGGGGGSIGGGSGGGTR